MLFSQTFAKKKVLSGSRIVYELQYMVRLGPISLVAYMSVTYFSTVNSGLNIVTSIYHLCLHI